MGRERNSKSKNGGRDGGGFIALPYSVVDSVAYMTLSHVSRTLLIEIARQYVRDNNGRLLASKNYLMKRGWKSSDVIQRAKKELIEKGFIYETVKGHRPNKASWYALTWHDLDRHPGYDSGTFEAWKDARSGYSKMNRLKITKVTPSNGVGKVMTAPLHGIETSSVAPSKGAIKGSFGYQPSPPYGNHLDMPSTLGH